LEGVTIVASGHEAAQGEDIVITMLPNGEVLRNVASQIIPVMQKGAVLLYCGRGQRSRSGCRCSAAGLFALDVPVSGGVVGATDGTLTFMVGGEDAGFVIAKPLFDIMGQTAVFCGPSGNGQAAKICNNMVLGATMIVTCEAFALADKLGLDRQAMFDVVSTSSGFSWSMNAYCPAPGVGPVSPADRNYEPGCASELMLKDLRLSQMAAKAANADTLIGALATQLYEQFVENEGGKGKDFSAILPLIASRKRDS